MILSTARKEDALRKLAEVIRRRNILIDRTPLDLSTLGTKEPIWHVFQAILDLQTKDMDLRRQMEVDSVEKRERENSGKEGLKAKADSQQIVAQMEAQIRELEMLVRAQRSALDGKWGEADGLLVEMEGTGIRPTFDGFAALKKRVGLELQEQRRRQANSEEREARWKELRFEFVRLEGGTFTMGSDKGELDEQPPHKTSIARPFEIGKYEVTQAVYELVMGENPSRFRGRFRPVESVTFTDVESFLARLNLLNDGYSYRLPTEAEWEYAAQSTSGPAAGQQSNPPFWYFDNSKRETHEVGTSQANSRGLHDLFGNVFEWCQDWYGDNYYLTSPKTDPMGPTAGMSRVARGGGYGTKREDIRASFRGNTPPDTKQDYLGFRVVRVRRESGGWR